VRQARLARLFFPQIPLLCMGAAPDAAEFLADGVVAYLEKPFTIEALQAAISSLVPVVA
jgi:CheY-like chemotaxis protein